MRILRLAAFALAAATLSLAAPPAWTQGHGGNFHGGRIGIGGMHRGGGGGAFVHPGFAHPGAFHRGTFVHGFHGGNVGWWLVAGGIWYPWDAYGAPYAAYGPAYGEVWYFCGSAGAYYPYVTYCPEGWVLVTPP